MLITDVSYSEERDGVLTTDVSLRADVTRLSLDTSPRAVIPSSALNGVHKPHETRSYASLSSSQRFFPFSVLSANLYYGQPHIFPPTNSPHGTRNRSA